MTQVRLQIIGPHGIIMDCGRDEDILVPLGEDERMVAFHALTDALALLSGLTPQALDAGTAKSPEESVACPADQTAGVVVRLPDRRAARDEPAAR
jgi:hypothetical protein